MFTVILFLIAGAIAGLLAGLFGLGGGVIIVPMLAEIFTHLGFEKQVIMHMAIGTSLSIMFFTASVAAHRHQGRGGIDWQVVKLLAPTLLIGAFLGTQIADIFNTDILQFLFGIFLIFTAINIVLTFRTGKSLFQFKELTSKHHLVAGSIIGTLAGLLGIGGGVLTVPWLMQAGYHSRVAAGCSSACTLLIATSGVFGSVLAGLNETGMPDYSFSFIYLPAALCVAVSSSLFAPLGVRLSYKLPSHIVGYMLAGLLILISLRLLIMSVQHF